MHAQSPQDQDRIPVVRERKDGNNGLFEILKSSEKQIHCSPDVMTFPELKVKRPLFARPVTSHSTHYQLLELSVRSLEVRIGSLHAVNIISLRFGKISRSITLI
uniref:ORF103 n=1 Tax=Pinus koraiensis TaxID=88728 RepID=Q85WT4_PINKO|nr:ORF103 [Pinus koraiensis]AAO74135.1 ORF103 [Pinus koraiensis]